MLTLLTIITGSNNNMPKINYMKAIDVYFAGCFFFVFCSLVEFTAVCYLDVAGEMELMQSGDTPGTSSPDGNNRDEDQLNDSNIRIAQKEKYFLHDKHKVNYSHRKVSTNCFSYSICTHCTVILAIRFVLIVQLFLQSLYSVRLQWRKIRSVYLLFALGSFFALSE